MSNTDFMGRDGFIWFAGVVEDRKDPLKLGIPLSCSLSWLSHRRPQCFTRTIYLFGFTHYYLLLHLAYQASIRRLLDLVEGSWVIGFFRDADTKQDAVILGIVSGKPSQTGVINAD